MNLEKYIAGSKINKIVYKDIIQRIENGETSVKELCEYGTGRILEECKKVFKKGKNMQAFPVSISLDDCIGNYYYEEGNDKYNNISKDSVVKIEFGTDIDGCRVMFGDTYCMNGQNKFSKILDELEKKIIFHITPGSTTDELRIMIEQYCIDLDCFPIENTFSYQHSILDEIDKKYMVLNYQKYYDEEDNVIVEPNTCFEFEENDIFTIDLKLAQNSQETSEKHDEHICRLNEYVYNLKLKSSRVFYTECKKENGTNGFYKTKYTSNARNRIGIKECIEQGIMDRYPILYTNDHVYSRKFTIILKKKCVKY